MRIRIRYYKSRVLHLNVQGSHDKIIITIVPSYTGKNITRLLPLALLLVLCTRNNTDRNKLVIFSGISLYYGETYFAMLPVQDVHCFVGWTPLVLRPLISD